jgi:O-antigen ligase
MSDDIFIIAIFFLLSAFPLIYAILYKPKIFYTFYLLLSTGLFGFLPMNLSLRIPAIMFFLNCAMLLTVIVSLLKGRKLSSKMILLFLVCVLVLITFGILYPSYLGFSSISRTIINGKDMFGYAALAYLAINHKHFDFKYFFRLFSFIAVTLVIVLIIGFLTGYCPPGYFQHEGNIIQVNHSTYISIAVLLLASKMLGPRINLFLILLFLFMVIGLLVQGHRSIILTTFLAVSLLWLVQAHISVKLLSLIIGIPLLFAFYLVDDGRIFESKIVEPITELRDESGHIEYRNNINTLRLLYIAQRPLLGYGFIHKISPLGEEIEEHSVSRFNETLGVVDSGYIDMIVRFGIVGTILFCIVFGLLLYNRLRNVTALMPGQLAMLLFISTYFLINYTLSVFTYDTGIICLCIGIFLLYRKNSTDMANTNDGSLQEDVAIS